MAQTTTKDSYMLTITNRLDTLAKQKPEMAEPIAFYRAALPLLREAQTAIEPFTLPAETARHKLAAGIPLLLGEDARCREADDEAAARESRHVQERATVDFERPGCRHGYALPPPFRAASLIASRMRRYVPHLQMLPLIADAMSSSVGSGVDRRSAEAAMS